MQVLPLRWVPDVIVSLRRRRILRCAISDRNLLQEWNHQSENMGSRSARAPSTSDLLLDVLHDKITCLGRELSESIALLPDK